MPMSILDTLEPGTVCTFCHKPIETDDKVIVELISCDAVVLHEEAAAEIDAEDGSVALDMTWKEVKVRHCDASKCLQGTKEYTIPFRHILAAAKNGCKLNFPAASDLEEGLRTSPLVHAAAMMMTHRQVFTEVDDDDDEYYAVYETIVQACLVFYDSVYSR